MQGDPCKPSAVSRNQFFQTRVAVNKVRNVPLSGEDDSPRRWQYKVVVRPGNDALYNCIKESGARRRHRRHSIEYLSFNFIPCRAVGVSAHIKKESNKSWGTGRSRRKGERAGYGGCERKEIARRATDSLSEHNGSCIPHRGWRSTAFHHLTLYAIIIHYVVSCSNRLTIFLEHRRNR